MRKVSFEENKLLINQMLKDLLIFIKKFKIKFNIKVNF